MGRIWGTWRFREICSMTLENFGNFLVSNQVHLQFTSGALNCTRLSICATAFYLPLAYDASACGALVEVIIMNLAQTISLDDF